MFGISHYISHSKRIKIRHQEEKGDRVYLTAKYKVPKEGYPIDEETAEKEKGIVFYVPTEEEYFNPKDRRLLNDPLELYKAALIIDRVHGIRRLKEPLRECTFSEEETVVYEVPLTEYENYRYKDVVQELGHVGWYKAYFYVDKETFPDTEFEVNVVQVLKKIESKVLPRWKPRNKYWNEPFIGTVEVPGTIFCTELALIKKVKKYFKWQSYSPEIVHTRDVSQTQRDTIGCSVFRRHQPPRLPKNTSTVAEEDKTWNGLEDRNQWVFSSLFNIWAGEEAVPEYEKRERVYWTGPDSVHCACEIYCQEVVEVEDIEEEVL